MERAPLAHGALDPDPPLHHAHQFRRDGQAETGTAVLARRRRVPLLERLKDGSSSCSAGMPMPVSRTGKMQADLLVAAPRFFDRDSDLALLGELDGVADQVEQDLAQPRRIAAHDRRQAASATLAVSSIPFCWAFTSSVLTVSRTTSASGKSISSISILPASILDRSRISFSSPSSSSLDERTVCRYPRCSSLKGVASASSVMPMMAFMGVRISWLRLARNSLLRRLFVSAVSLAVRNASSVWRAS